MTGAAARAARSVCCTAQVLGASSATTKMTTTSKAVAITTPSAPKAWAATTPTRVAATRVHTSRANSTTGRTRVDALDQAQQGAGAAPFLLGQGLGLDLRRPGDAPSPTGPGRPVAAISTTTTTSRMTSVPPKW